DIEYIYFLFTLQCNLVNRTGNECFLLFCKFLIFLHLPPTAGDQKCKSGPVDLVFIIDGSRSVRPHEFETMRKFMIDIIHELDVGLDATRVGVVQYSSQVQNVFSLKDFTTHQQMVKAINEIIPLAQGTMTGLAIRYAMNVAFSTVEGARTNVPHVAVIVTDGRPQDRVAEVAAAARESGIEIYAVGVARADMTSLRAMASPPFEDHVFLVETSIHTEFFGFAEIDLCIESDHGCDHICESSPGSYQCLCLPGYTLNDDGKTCTGTLPTKRILVHSFLQNCCNNATTTFLRSCHSISMLVRTLTRLLQRLNFVFVQPFRGELTGVF
uniref:Matrilin 4 n=1 Tax=Astyanax mexicanus TaxID=7994 RepID=A0A8B9J4N2_ASTMX